MALLSDYMKTMQKQCVPFILLILLGSFSNAFAFTFQEAVQKISSHEAVQAIKQSSMAITQDGRNKSAWGDPVFRVSAKNFPVESLSYDQTPMTGIEFGISQNIPITNKYGKIQDAFDQLAQAKKYQSKDKQRQLIQSLWLILIENRQIEEEIVIVEENLQWIGNIAKVSERLYENGSISQQALLDIKIRQSELEAQLSNKKYELQEQLDLLGYVLGFNNTSLEKDTIPWHILDKTDEKPTDTKQKSFEHDLSSKESNLLAQKRDVVPDVTISLGYSLRSDIDQNGDFISAMVGFPFPVSGKKSSSRNKAAYEKASAENTLEDYKKYKESRLRQQKHQIEKINKELDILNHRSIEFAKNSRQVTSKSYSHGRSTYIELLQSELKLQKLLIQRSQLDAKLRSTKATYKLLVGDKLYE